MISPDQQKTFYTIIQKYFPDITRGRITFLDDGWDHYVFVVDGKITFRFPRTSENGDKDIIETEFFKTFAPTSPVRVQEMEYKEDESGIHYEIYDFIPGVRFLKDLAATFSEKELDNIAESLGKFFTKLHAFPMDEAKRIGMDSIISAIDYADYWAGFLQHIQKDMYQYFSAEEQKWIESIFTEYVETVKKEPYELKVTHFDMLPEHILVDEKTHQLSGIIDFSLRISDPAYDFSYLDRYGEKFLQKVLENYPPANTEPNFELRRKFYGARLGFSFLSQALERQKEKIPGIIEQIHEYIKLH